jgi:hypothetical protein
MRLIAAIVVFGASATVAPSIAATALSWQVHTFASEFWVLDHLSEWDLDDSNACRVGFEQRLKVDDTRREKLVAYPAPAAPA